jgi:hypothetical protein
MRQITLRNKQKEIVGYSIVSEQDFEDLNKRKWYINGNGYVASTFNKKTWSMHRYIFIELQKQYLTSKNIIDHIDNNPLNNSRENLRIVTPKENSRNKQKRKNTSSKYIGVYYNKKSKRWESRFRINDKVLLASYDNEDFAGYQYNLWCKEYKIEHANLNKIDEPKDFIVYSKKQKIVDLPKYIYLTKHKKYRVNIKGKHYGYFFTLEEAKNRIINVKKDLQDTEDKTRNSLPIKRNDSGQAIIELFNIKKEKVGETIVDDDNYYDLLRYSGHLRKYAKITVNNKSCLVHRYIMNYYGDDYVDHINGNPLDNRKCNLRIVTASQNCKNKKSKNKSSSKYLGVYWDKSNNTWCAAIGINGKQKSLGSFENEMDAAKCRDEATKKYFGEYGNLNFTAVEL